jgi:hypothetical protein
LPVGKQSPEAGNPRRLRPKIGMTTGARNCF